MPVDIEKAGLVVNRTQGIDMIVGHSQGVCVNGKYPDSPSLHLASQLIIDLSPRIQHLRRQQEQLQARKWELEALLAVRHKELVDLEMVTRCVDDLRNLLDESSITERKSFIRSFVKEIKVTGDEVLLTYTMPLPPEGTLEEKMPVLYSVHPSGVGRIRTDPLRCFSVINIPHQLKEPLSLLNILKNIPFTNNNVFTPF